ncbi:MAG: DUF4405 domain-containing protein [Myxococcales bacterium]|nr:DUF4405 domain-containing protein [Myxococcales bacterium]
MPKRTVFNFWLDLVSLLVMLGLALTGGLIHFVLPAGTGHHYHLLGWSRHDYGQLHFYLAVAAVALLFLHIVLHWNWICCVIAKACGGASPSSRGRLAAGVALIVATLLVLVGGLWWASSGVQKTAGDLGPRGHVAVLEKAPISPPGDEVVSSARPPMEVSGKSASAGGAVGEAHDKHLEDCPAAAAINGRTTLESAAKACGLSIDEFIRQVGLPTDVDSHERLGRLKRRYGIDLHAVRKRVCQ